MQAKQGLGKESQMLRIMRNFRSAKEVKKNGKSQ